jgi:hypothetical protein
MNMEIEIARYLLMHRANIEDNVKHYVAPVRNYSLFATPRYEVILDAIKLKLSESFQYSDVSEVVDVDFIIKVYGEDFFK